MITGLVILGGIILVFGIVVFRGAPYVPSLRTYAAEALEQLYPVTQKDVVVDLGSGDGIVLRLAAARGARAVGYELNPVLVVISKLMSRGNPLIETRLADFWLVDLPEATTMVYAFSVGRDMEKLARKIQHTADKVGHPIWLITYGHTIASRVVKKSTPSHHLYLFEPAV